MTIDQWLLQETIKESKKDAPLILNDHQFEKYVAYVALISALEANLIFTADVRVQNAYNIAAEKFVADMQEAKRDWEEQVKKMIT